MLNIKSHQELIKVKEQIIKLFLLHSHSTPDDARHLCWCASHIYKFNTKERTKSQKSFSLSIVKKSPSASQVDYYYFLIRIVLKTTKVFDLGQF